MLLVSIRRARESHSRHGTRLAIDEVRRVWLSSFALFYFMLNAPCLAGAPTIPELLCRRTRNCASGVRLAGKAD